MFYKCVSNTGYVNIKLTVGNIYENLFDTVEEMDGSEYLYINDDRGLGYYVDIEDFILLDDYREDVLNQMGI